MVTECTPKRTSPIRIHFCLHFPLKCFDRVALNQPMKKFLIISGILLAGLALLVTVVAFWGVGVRNTANGLRESITAKEQANTTVFDNMWKKISQSAQVTDAQKDALKEIFTGYAQARSGGGGGSNGSFINAVHEAIPQVDVSVFRNLQNII